MVARRLFTGWWEYMIDGGLFTAPPRFEHSGAGLLDPDGRLIGIGSLWVSDAPEAGAIERTIRAALKLDCSRVENPYGDGHSAERIVAALKSVPDPRALIRKRFVDA